MFKLPNLPSPQADPHELADYAELLCWVKGSASARQIVAYLGRINDNDNKIGCLDDEDKNADTLDEVMNEIDRRESACRQGYPFHLNDPGTALRLNDGAQETEASIIYLYLLLCTRFNMKDNRIHADIDGTQLMEKLSAHVLKNYLGATRAKACVFGTSQEGTFKDKVNSLCRDLGEGTGFRALDEAPTQANDDKLDTVGWIPFTDQLPGQLIVFGQCKTGTNWKDSTTQLQPDVFIDSWIQDPILVNPLRAFFVAEAADRARWKGYSKSAGVLFDRCRIVDWCDGMPIDKIKTWALAAKNKLQAVIDS